MRKRVSKEGDSYSFECQYGTLLIVSMTGYSYRSVVGVFDMNGFHEIYKASDFPTYTIENQQRNITVTITGLPSHSAVLDVKCLSGW